MDQEQSGVDGHSGHAAPAQGGGPLSPRRTRRRILIAAGLGGIGVGALTSVGAFTIPGLVREDPVSGVAGPAKRVRGR
ncbi:hypothetical protein APR12_000461 [Nocardia amikacinitolerans]|nr:hypothetical protein [Nocardia amikacinitolerans]